MRRDTARVRPMNIGLTLHDGSASLHGHRFSLVSYALCEPEQAKLLWKRCD